MSVPSSPRAANRTFLIVVGLMVVAALVAVFVIRIGSPGEVPPSIPALASIEIHSLPSGATVRLGDGGVLGVTPFTAELPKGPGVLPVVFSYEGYQDHHLTVPLFSSNGRIDTKLTRLGEDAAVPPALPDGWSP